MNSNWIRTFSIFVLEGCCTCWTAIPSDGTIVTSKYGFVARRERRVSLIEDKRKNKAKEFKTHNVFMSLLF